MIVTVWKAGLVIVTVWYWSSFVSLFGELGIVTVIVRKFGLVIVSVWYWSS